MPLVVFLQGVLKRPNFTIQLPGLMTMPRSRLLDRLLVLRCGARLTTKLMRRASPLGHQYGDAGASAQESTVHIIHEHAAHKETRTADRHTTHACRGRAAVARTDGTFTHTRQTDSPRHNQCGRLDSGRMSSSLPPGAHAGGSTQHTVHIKKTTSSTLQFHVTPSDRISSRINRPRTLKLHKNRGPCRTPTHTRTIA